MCFELYTKYTEKFNGSKLGYLNSIPIPLCVNELIHTLVTDKSERYNGFWYANGNMINQHDEYQLKEDEVFHIHMELLNDKTNIFIKESPNPSLERYPTQRNVVNLDS